MTRGSRFNLWELFEVPELPDDGDDPIGVIITGPPGSGKTTFVKNVGKRGYNAIDGDNFGHDGGPVHTSHWYRVHRWIQEELHEMAKSKTLLDYVDGIYDMMGILYAELDTISPLDKHTGFEDYVSVQKERGRPAHPFFSVLEHAATLTPLTTVDIFEGRYQTDDVWNMDWILDLELVEQAVLKGNIVACTGGNWQDLHLMAERLQFEGKAIWIHLNVPFGRLMRRLNERAKAKDWKPPIPALMNQHVLNELSSAVGRGANLITPTSKWSTGDMVAVLRAFGL